MCIAFCDRNPFDHGLNGRVHQPVSRDLLDPDAAMNRLCRDGKGQRILRHRGAVGHALEQTGAFMEGVDLDVSYVIGAEPVCQHQITHAVDRRMRPAADRIGLYILRLHHPAAAEIGPEGCRLFSLDRDRRRAGETTFGQNGRGDTDHRTPARPVMQHAGVRDLAHHLAAGAVIFGDADGLAKL